MTNKDEYKFKLEQFAENLEGGYRKLARAFSTCIEIAQELKQQNRDIFIVYSLYPKVFMVFHGSFLLEGAVVGFCD